MFTGMESVSLDLCMAPSPLSEADRPVGSNAEYIAISTPTIGSHPFQMCLVGFFLQRTTDLVSLENAVVHSRRPRFARDVPTTPLHNFHLKQFT